MLVVGTNIDIKGYIRASLTFKTILRLILEFGQRTLGISAEAMDQVWATGIGSYTKVRSGGLCFLRIVFCYSCMLIYRNEPG